MKRLFALILSGSMFAIACGTNASDATDTPLTPENGAATATAPAAAQPLASTASASAGAEARPAPARPAPAGPTYRDVTIPSGTALTLRLTSPVASDTSKVEDTVSAELTEAVMIDGRMVLPAGATVSGDVTEADDSGRVKGRAQVSFRFNAMITGGDTYPMMTASLSRMAPATKGEDALKIGIGAGAGAAIGGLLGGKDGAAKGAAIGGGAGTGVVLATKGQEVRLAAGADVSTQLTAPLTVRVRVS